MRLDRHADLQTDRLIALFPWRVKIDQQTIFTERKKYGNSVGCLYMVYDRLKLLEFTYLS